MGDGDGVLGAWTYLADDGWEHITLIVASQTVLRTSTCHSNYPIGLDKCSHLLDPRNEKFPITILPPHQHANLLGVSAWRLILCLIVELLEQEPPSRFHPVTLKLPQPYLIDYGRRQDSGILAVHLGMCVHGQVGDNLIAGDAHAHRFPDGIPGDFASHHVRILGRKAGEETEDGELQFRGGVGVDSVIRFYDDEAAVVV